MRGGVSRNAKLVVGHAPVGVVSYGGRSFQLESAADALDLRRAIAAEASYLPHQRPASFYVELDPVASRAGSGLAGDLRHADTLLLGGPWDALHEPNASSHDGSPAANEVVARLFCRRGRFGTYELFARCG